MEYQAITDIFEELESLQRELTKSGHEKASALISEGVSGLNGLTDGWAYLLEDLNLVCQKSSSTLNPEIATKLNGLKVHIHGIVHRE